MMIYIKYNDYNNVFIQICVCELYSVLYMCQAFDEDFIYICLRVFRNICHCIKL